MRTERFSIKLWRKLAIPFLCGAGALSNFSAPAESAPAGEIDLHELAKFDLETLLNMEVTSASRKEERLSESATAIYVITQEDIRRSGFTTLPELFRMVPGMQVARVNANQWAISSRGFNDAYSDKLLVMIDGRSVYTPSFGGVFWVDQDLVLQNLDRIEVIRGPGATLWGANAVNGVINVITKKAKETQGLMLSSTYGTLEQPSTSLRYGGKLSDSLYYRVSAKYFNHDNLEDARGQSLADDWRMGSGALRLDWTPTEENTLTLDAGLFRSSVGESFRIPELTPPYESARVTDNHNSGGHLLTRWTSELPDESSFSLQAYFDRSDHREFGVSVAQDTFDLESQYRFHPLDRNEVIIGAGYRYLPDEITSTGPIGWANSQTDHQLINFFAQDEITLVEDLLKFTVGSKFEHNDYTGLELQPSARLIYTPTARQSIWASISRAVRTPNRADTSLRGDFRVSPTGINTPPLLLRNIENPDFASEEVIAYELGYRVRPRESVSIDVAGFFNSLNGFRSYVPGEIYFEPAPSPHLVLPTVASNSLDGITYGAELSAEWAPLDHLRFHAGYSWMAFDMSADDPSLQSTPEQQLHLRSYLDLPHGLELMGAVYYVDSIFPTDGLNSVAIPSYFRVDAGITWRPIKSLELGIWGQNLLDPGHPEFTSYRSASIAEIPRSVLGKITWSY